MPDETAESRLKDEELLAATARGDEGAFEMLVLRHEISVFRFVRFLVPAREAAEDAVQETFLAVYRFAASFEARSSVKTWILTIARNKAARLRPGRPDEAIDDLETLEELGAAAGWGAADPEEELLLAEKRAPFDEALSRLPKHEREVVVLRGIEGLDGEETARALGIPVRAMKSRLHRARLRLTALVRKGEAIAE